MLLQVMNNISQLNELPEFSTFYQDYVKEMQDCILDSELIVNNRKMTQLKNFNCVLTQLNELTEELKRYEKFVD